MEDEEKEEEEEEEWALKLCTNCSNTAFCIGQRAVYTLHRPIYFTVTLCIVYRYKLLLEGSRAKYYLGDVGLGGVIKFKNRVEK